MKPFRTLDLAIRLYRDCQRLALKGPLKDQFERAVLSVPLNLAEGSAKPTAKDRRKFYFISLGSLREVQTLLTLIGDPELIRLADVLGAHLYKLCKRT
jgi:four helix bundle protein